MPANASAQLEDIFHGLSFQNRMNSDLKCKYYSLADNNEHAFVVG